MIGILVAMDSCNGAKPLIQQMVTLSSIDHPGTYCNEVLFIIEIFLYNEIVFENVSLFVLDFSGLFLLRKLTSDLQNARWKPMGI